jgi:hypothetical protein
MNSIGQINFNKDIINRDNEKNHYLSSYSYKTLMSLINYLHKITTAIYMVTDCVEGDEPLRKETRLAILSTTKELHKLLNSKESSSFVIKNVHSHIVLVRDYVSLLETMGYITKMNATILSTELDKFVSEMDRAKLDIDSTYHTNVPLRRESNMGIDLGSVFYGLGSMESLLESTENTTKDDQKEAPTLSLYNIDLRDSKNKRKSTIIKILKDTPMNQNGSKELSLNDLVFKYERYSGEASVSTKTIQRELIELIAAGVIEKVGTKRWVQYKLVS